MATYLHTMYRITDPDAQPRLLRGARLRVPARAWTSSAAASVEATNYFFGVPDQDEELELTFNHDGRTYELGTALRPHRARRRGSRRHARLAEQGIEPEAPYRVREGGSRSASSAIPTATGSS